MTAMRVCGGFVLLGALAGCAVEDPEAGASTVGSRDRNRGRIAVSGSPRSVNAGDAAPHADALPGLDAIDAQPVADFAMRFGLSNGVSAADPNKAIRLRGTVKRITPSRVGYAPNAKRIEPRLWLYADAYDLMSAREPGIACTLTEASRVDAVRIGQTIAIEGHYWGDTNYGIIFLEDCRILGAGPVPEDAPASEPYPSQAELKSLGENLIDFRQVTPPGVKLEENLGNQLTADISAEALNDGRALPGDLLDMLAEFPIRVVKLPGSAARSLLANIDRFPKIETLILETPSEIVAEDLNALKRARSIDTLWIEHAAQLDDAMARAIAGCTSLQHVTIVGQSRLTDSGIQALAGLPALRTLWIGGGHSANASLVTDAVIEPLSKSTHLRSLRIEGAAISGEGFRSLRKGAFPALRILELPGCRLTDAAADGLIGAEIRLRGMNIQRTGVTEAGIMRLYESRLVKRIAIDDKAVGDEARTKLETAEMVRARAK